MRTAEVDVEDQEDLDIISDPKSMNIQDDEESVEILNAKREDFKKQNRHIGS